ncbi:hypothetical protein CSKR_201371 [Clonorchis sinensis]|uniref:LEM domain-containing protein n=1 Tax=Clonorchis sinensis TaxID=79923 RepID=A0A8T1MQL6_CLOSI|nr:hypothetical protein CSKR_201371 [Clonorchis sinensis]
MEVLAHVESLTDDEIRSMLKEYGYNPPPIQDSITRKILRKKLALYIDPSINFEEKSPEGDFSGERTTSSDGIRLRAEGKQRSAAVRTNENASVKTNWARIAIVLCLLALIPVVIYVRVFA